ncbi:hypothetical protein EX30DRAFT_213593 [Ascodesmis nigricans]|uniref:Mid2 domain-containing protein n=1 Tax=Ascodesmis nigricans TaxID=341454 RepID=A0A4V3SIZ2_9PEZI|nr:hypothetical protein EX30DRAFT_213593 [Ascodesmis nigricans]
MRPPHLLAALLVTGTAVTSAWEVTSWIAETVSTYTYRNPTLYSYTNTVDITLTASPASPSVAPTSSYIYSDTYYSITYTTFYLPASAFPDPLPTSTYGGYGFDYTYQKYYVDSVFFTAPAYCSSKWTYTSTRTLDVPSAITNQLTPIATKTSLVTGSYDVYTRVYYMLKPGLFPTPTTAYAEPTRSILRKLSCERPYSQEEYNDSYNSGDSGSSWRDDSDLSYADGEKYYTWTEAQWAQSSVRAGAIAAIVIFFTLVLAGFAESYFWFSRLMSGKQAWRGGTWCWAIATIWGFCLLHRQKKRENGEERKELADKWKEMPKKEKLQLWGKWGFRWAYPEKLLGMKPGSAMGESGSVENGVGGVVPAQQTQQQMQEVRQGQQLPSATSPAPPAPDAAAPAASTSTPAPVPAVTSSNAGNPAPPAVYPPQGNAPSPSPPLPPRTSGESDSRPSAIV